MYCTAIKRQWVCTYRFVYWLAQCLVTRQHFSIMCACIVELLFLLVCILLILLCGSLGSTNIVLPTCATLSMNHEIRSSLNFCTNNWFKLINCILNFAYMHGQQRSRSGISKKTFDWRILQDNPEWCNPAGQASSTEIWMHDTKQIISLRS